jgi:hypothetical protein
MGGEEINQLHGRMLDKISKREKGRENVDEKKDKSARYT